MPRRSKRKSRFDTFMERVTMVFITVSVAIFALVTFVAEQPVIAAILTVVVAVLIVVVPTMIFLFRRRARQRQARLHIQQAQHLGQLLTVSGAEFEDIAVDLFQAIGYRDVQRIGGSGDLGIDLFGTDADGLRVIIQCKRYGRGQKIGSPVVQALMGAVVNNDADRGIFVTTSTFTAPAIQHATTARIPIELIDGPELTRLAMAASTTAESPQRRGIEPS